MSEVFWFSERTYRLMGPGGRPPRINSRATIFRKLLLINFIGRNFSMKVFFFEPVSYEWHWRCCVIRARMSFIHSFRPTASTPLSPLPFHAAHRITSGCYCDEVRCIRKLTFLSWNQICEWWRYLSRTRVVCLIYGYILLYWKRVGAGVGL